MWIGWTMLTTPPPPLEEIALPPTESKTVEEKGKTCPQPALSVERLA
jgi:hypothetical protein